MKIGKEFRGIIMLSRILHTFNNSKANYFVPRSLQLSVPFYCNFSPLITSELFLWKVHFILMW